MRAVRNLELTMTSLSKKPSDGRPDGDKLAHSMERSGQAGALVINADDWGRDRETTDRILAAVCRGTVSSVSAMVFMEDSERAAATARERGIDAGLHLNFTTPLSGTGDGTLVEHQRRLCRYLLRHRFAQTVFHPGLTRSFAFVVAAQLEEFRRLYGAEPNRIDGHHHMHLCANVLLGQLLPSGTTARRNFSFRPGEKGFINHAYRQLVDRQLRRRHRLMDFLFPLAPLDSPHGRLQRIFSLALRFAVEVETHPVNPDEYRFLTEGEIVRQAGDIQIARGFTIRRAAAPDSRWL